MDLRKVTYRLYPTKAQAAALIVLLRSHQQLYNAALEQRIDAWRRRRVSLGYADQCRELTDLRRECPAFADANCSSQQRTLRRLDIAFQAFFRRVAVRGERAGFPRFKSLEAFPGFGFKRHGDGWRFTPGADWKHGKLRLQGVGVVKARGQARQGGVIKACELLHRDGAWVLSLTVECETIERRSGTAACGLDWGVETFAALAMADGRERSIANPRRVAKAARALRTAQRALARKQRGGKARQRARRAVAALHRPCGLSHREAARFLQVRLDTVKSWSIGRNACSARVLAELVVLAARIDTAALEALTQIEAMSALHGGPDEIDLGIASDDVKAQSIGWPCVGAQRASLGLIVARGIAKGYRFRVSPRGSTSVTAAAADAHDLRDSG